MKLTADKYTNNRTGQIFQNAEITTGDLFVSENLITLNIHLKAVGGLDQIFKLFWNNQSNDLILVERLDKNKIQFTTAVKNLSEILPNDSVKSYGKMDITGLKNNYAFDGQIPFEFNPTTELGWHQLFNNVTFFGENLFKQFKSPKI
jgi:hypothetical protein